MKFPLIPIFMASALLIAACGDDSSSNPTVSDNKETQSPEKDPGTDSTKTSENPKTDDGIVKRASYILDEANNYMIMTRENQYENLCVLEGGSLVWEPKFMYAVDTSMFEFRGDSLVVYSYYDGEPDYGEILVGGTPGKLEGTWRHTGCEMNYATHFTDCDEELVRYREMSYVITKDSVVATLKFHTDRYLADNGDFTNSIFMLQLYRHLSRSDYGVYPNTLFEMDSSAVQTVIGNNDITIQEQSRTHAVFEIRGKTYEFDVKKANITVAMDGLFSGSTGMELRLDISSNGTTCNLSHAIKYVNEPLCRDEYMDHLRIDDEMEDAEDNKFAMAYRFEDTNYDDFEECLGSL